MIPVRLELYNFLAYREPPPLDFTGLHVVCLAGANGAGKSSLLDAMTWALWGKARGRRDDELIHIGETEMRVDLTFSLMGNLYRVARYRSSQGRGRSALGLEIQDSGDWRSIAESTMKATQDKINRLLRMDYNTFINSAFLVQGRADEFTTKTATERKTILGDILGLERWDVYEERAKEHLRRIRERRGTIESQLGEIDRELAQEDTYQRDLIEAQNDLIALNEQVDDVEEKVQALEEIRHRRDARHAEQDDVTRRMAQGEGELAAILGDRDRHQARLDTMEGTLAARAEIEAGYAALLEARQTDRDFNQRLREQADLSTERSRLEQAIAEEHARLQADRRVLSQQVGDLERAIADGVSEETLIEVHEEIEALEARQAERDDLKSQEAALREEVARLEADNRALQRDMDALDVQRDQIKTVQEPACPLCGQPLNDEHRAELIAQFEQEGAEKGEAWRENQTQRDVAKKEIADLRRTIETLDGELRRLPPLQQREGQLIDRDQRAREARSDLEEVRADLAEVEAVLSGETYAQEVRAALASVQDQLADLGYDEAAHRAAQQAIADYESFSERKAELDRALADIPETSDVIQRLEERAAAWEASLAEDRERRDRLADEVAGLDAQLVDLEWWRNDLERARNERSLMQTRVGAAQQRIRALENQRDRRASLVGESDALGEEQAIYQELRTAFGKDGVPAMIIEAAIPEIEESANQILSSMTDAQMRVRFETQKELISTERVVETLEIKITDRLGTRDYDLYSGGEAFRVNFAIRLALSRLLARRAGAQLRTLIIDEGFGTQDAQGRERLVQSIKAIQDDFDLVLVITHIDELKDAFPARIEVTKTPDGSMIELV